MNTNLQGPLLSEQSRETTTDSSGTTQAAAAASPPPCDPRFSCNICFDDVSDPVVTQCGHLYCWGCLFRWMEPGLTPAERQALNLPILPAVVAVVDQSHRVCPVCKSPCSVTSIIPIYVRNEEHQQQQQPPTNESQNSPQFGEEESSSQQGTANWRPTQTAQGDFVPEHSPESLDLASSAMHQSPPPDDNPDNPPIVSSDFGLRQRLRFRSSDSQQTANNATTASSSRSDATATTTSDDQMEVPARPVPRRRRSFSENAVGNLQHEMAAAAAAANGNNRTMAISQGLALSLHRALGPHQNDALHTTSSSSTASVIPPLHRREGHGSAARMGAAAAAAALDETDPDATEFLSRILLMLGSFVVLCLLLF